MSRYQNIYMCKMFETDVIWPSGTWFFPEHNESSQFD